MKKDFLSIKNLSKQNIEYILELSIKLKKESKEGIYYKPLEGKSFALAFEKPSTRTYVSFVVAIQQLGGNVVTLPQSSLGNRESLHDISQTLSRYVDGIIIRTFAQSTLESIAEHAAVPVINALSDKYHPCQIMADYQTIVEHKGIGKKKIAYLGDGFNISHTLLEFCAKVGYDLSVATPKGYEPDAGIVAGALQEAKDSKLEITNSPEQALIKADIIYTDTWTSMGKENESAKRMPLFLPFQVNSNLLKLAKSDALVMHCLPAHRGQEITDEVIDGPQSIVFDQAENRLHIQKAILCYLFE